MNKAMFSDAKVNSRVWDILKGWGKIVRITKTTITVQFDLKGSISEQYYKDGKRDQYHTNPTLFWDKVEIVPPERPKYCKCGNQLHGWYPRCKQCVHPEKPKEKCEACELIEDCERNCFGRGTRVYMFLLNQHHTCEKKDA